MKVTIIFSTEGPVINKEAKGLLEEISTLLADEEGEDAATKLTEFLDYVTVLEDDAKEAVA